MKRVLLFAIPLFAASCSDPTPQENPPAAVTEQLSFKNDAESGHDWLNEDQLEDCSFAHSGKRVSVTDTSKPYSFGLKKAMADISGRKIHTVTISAWIYTDSIPEKDELALVASVNTAEKSVFWHGAPVKDGLTESKKWLQVSGTIVLDYEQAPGLQFAGYLLNKTGARILVDDMEFTFSPE